MKIYVVKKGVIMSDDHKVNVDTRMEDMEVLPSEAKHLLLTWLFEFGRKTISHSVAWDYLVDIAKLNYDIDVTIEHCCDAKYIWRIESAKGYEYVTGIRYQLLDKGIEYINKGEKHDK